MVRAAAALIALAIAFADGIALAAGSSLQATDEATDVQIVSVLHAEKTMECEVEEKVCVLDLLDGVRARRHRVGESSVSSYQNPLRREELTFA